MKESRILSCYLGEQIALHPNCFIIHLFPPISFISDVPLGAAVLIFSLHCVLSAELHISSAVSKPSVLPSRKLTFY